MDAPVPAQAATLQGAGSVGTGREKLLLVIGVLAAVAVRAILVPVNGGWGDLDQYAGWVHRLATDLPFGASYRLDMSYMPGLVAVFGIIAHLVPGFATAADASDVGVRVALKLPPLLADGASAAAVFLLAAGPRPGRAAAALAVLVVPATWYLSSWWGQYDAIYVAASAWVAVLLVRDRPVAAGVLLGVALMTKPQALFLALPFAGLDSHEVACPGGEWALSSLPSSWRPAPGCRSCPRAASRTTCAMWGTTRMTCSRFSRSRRGTSGG